MISAVVFGIVHMVRYPRLGWCVGTKVLAMKSHSGDDAKRPCYSSG